MDKVKVVVTGPFNSGKTRFISTLSDIQVVSTERSISLPPAGQAAAKDTTTVALDFGRLTLKRGLVLHLFGTPGQMRFDFMWDILAEGMLGFIVMVDSVAPASFDQTRTIVDAFRYSSPVAYVVAANKQDRPGALPPEELRAALRIEPSIKVLPCVATNRESAQRVVLELLYAIRDRAAA